MGKIVLPKTIADCSIRQPACGMPLKQKQAAAQQFNLAKYLAGHHHPMAVDNISTLAVSLIACAAALAAFVWQLLRRKNKKSNQPQASVMRRNDAGHPLPNEHPAEGAVKKPKDVYDFDSVGVKRPTMLAVTTKQEEPSASELFIQRAFKIDRGFWREIEVSQNQMRGLDCLFAEANKLAWVPGSAFERHIFAVSFAPAVEQALKQGSHPRSNATAADLLICAIDETGMQLGHAMRIAGHASAEPARVQALWRALNPADKPHELDAELAAEMDVLQDRIEHLSQHVAALTAAAWQQRCFRVQELAQELRGQRTQGECGSAEFHVRLDELVEEVKAEAERIDAAVAERSRTVRTMEDADDALLHAIAYMYVREMTILVLRAAALLHVIAGDTFAHEVSCANHIMTDLEAFTDVKPLLAAASRLAHAPLESEAHRAMTDGAVERAGAIARHAQELEKVHDELFADLRGRAAELQARVDKCLLWQTHPRRYAVRLNDEGSIEKMFVLDA